MEILQAIVLGIVQGLTEFLPISSSGHLVLVPYFLKWTDPGLAFDVALHMGTLAAVLLYFWRDWMAMGERLLGRKKNLHATVDIKLIILGCVPAAIGGLLLKDIVETQLRSPLLIAGTLALFGIVLWYFDEFGKKKNPLESFTVRDALLVGAAQTLALVPGVSRSGITITAALALGYVRPAAMRFSFLLAAPITAGAGLVKAKYIVKGLIAGGPVAQGIIAGFTASLVSGLIAVWLLSLLLRTRSFTGFAVYRVLLALVIIITVIVGR